ncbi:MAG TPA: S8 family serine peptidase [Mycobacteriales bacterium]|nr:S8 family serine peptidase [Mycobacteriales bacterium]
MSLAGLGGRPVFARNTSWGGSSNTSWGGSSNTSWGGTASTSWGGSSNTSWGGGRGRAAMTALAVVLPLLAVLPFARPATTHRVVVVGAHAGQALHRVGATDVSLLTNGVAVGRASATASGSLRSSGFKVAPDSPVQLDGAPAFPQGPDTGGRLSVRDVTGAALLGTGKGETIAVIDSGVNNSPAFGRRLVQGADFTGTGFDDGYGHGTFVASLAAGAGGRASNGIEGVAPGARVVSVKVADSRGRSTVGQVVAGLAWVIQHRADYDIDVVNLSLSAKHASSYLTDPLDALVEAAWFSGMTVVASAGNDGGPVDSAPGNDPFVLTVGSVADMNTLTQADDTLSPYSNNGSTPDGVAKPEITAPGEHVQAALPEGSLLSTLQTVTGLPRGYGQLSGTSMAAGVASGAAAVLQSLHRDWTPGQVKGALQQTHGNNGEMRLLAAAMARPTDVTTGLTPSLALAVAYAQQVAHTRAYSDVVWSDVVWSDVVWSDVANVVKTAATWSNAVWSDATWSNAVWSDAVWSDATWSDAVWADATWSDGQSRSFG